MLWLAATTAPFEKRMHAASADSSTVLQDWPKLTPIWAAQQVNTPSVPLSVMLVDHRSRSSVNPYTRYAVSRLWRVDIPNQNRSPPYWGSQFYNDGSIRVSARRVLGILSRLYCALSNGKVRVWKIGTYDSLVWWIGTYDSLVWWIGGHDGSSWLFSISHGTQPRWIPHLPEDFPDPIFIGMSLNG